MEVLQYVLALVVTLGILVTVHEFGHFLVARRSGVKIVRFSVGFGRALWSWTDRHGTEFVVAAIPLGGYVRMLDEQDGFSPTEHVPPEDLARSFRRLSPSWRIAIALGGPAANFLLAVVVYWLLFVVGRMEVVPIVDEVSPEAPAYAAGMRGGEEVVGIDGEETPSWADVTMALASRLGDSGHIQVDTRRPGADVTQTHRLVIDDWHRGEDEPDLLESLGIVPTLPPVLGSVLPDSPAAAAGLHRWDRIVSADGQPVGNWADWVELVRAAPDTPLALVVERDGRNVELALTPGTQTSADGATFGYLGVGPVLREIAYGPLESVGRSLNETWSKTLLTLDLLKKMVTGLVSTRNLAGPITIAKVAGDSARSGIENFLGVLALLSISLGVLNLLPIPILDGGHIVFCVAELIIGRPVPERVQALGMQIGLFLVGGLMVLAFYNDITRLF